MCSLNYDFTILYKIFPMGYLEWSRLLIATIEFTTRIFKKSKKNIVNSIEVLLIIFWVLHYRCMTWKDTYNLSMYST